MNIVLDAIIFIIFITTVLVSVKRGFVKTLFGIISFWVAIILAFSFSPMLKTVLLESKLGNSVKTEFAEKITILEQEGNIKDIEDIDSADIDSIINNKEAAAFLEAFGINADDINKAVEEWKADGGGSIKDKITDFASNPLIDNIASVLAFILIFFAATIVLAIIEAILRAAVKLPVLKQADGFFGFVLGLTLAVFRICIFCVIVKAIIASGSVANNEFLMSFDVDKTVLFSFFSKFNLFSVFM